MATFGIVSIPTHYSFQPVDMPRWAEENDFDSLFYGELPMYYAKFFDPFIALTAAVIRKLKVRTSVSLVPEHHPIKLAKSAACLDHVSSGRFLFGIPARSNAE